MMSSLTLQTDSPPHPALEYVQQLEQLFPQDAAGAAQSFALESYRQLIAGVCAACARMEEHEGMISLLCILQEGLEQLVNQPELLTPRRLAFLARIPSLISEHMQFPDSKMPCSVMVRHLASESWVRPLTAEEQTWFLDRITGNHAPREEITEAVVIGLPAMDVGSEYVAGAGDGVSLDDFMLTAPQQDATVDAEACVQDEISLDDFVPVDVTAESQLNVVVQDEISLDDFIVRADETNTRIVMPKQAGEYSSATLERASGVPVPSAKILELVNLVAIELEEVIEFYHSSHAESGQDLNAVAQEAAVLADNIGNAVSLVGLEALAGLCTQLADFLKKTHSSEQSATLANIIEHWPRVVLNYLRGGFDSDTSTALINWFAEQQLLAPDASATAELFHRLTHPVFPEESLQAKHETARAEDVDLTLPEDVNPELLESLLQDLPNQTEALTHALTSMRDDKDIAQVEVAQRVAHTIKGSANVVGIKGLANLAHQLEDILENLTRARQLPAAALMNVLMEASDCIEAMSDALLGYDAAPEQALNVLQTLFDWINRINEQGLDAANTVESSSAMQPAAEQEAGQVAAKAGRATAAAVENSLRIPAHLADDLLRLAGENLITTGQIQDSIRNTLKKQLQLKNHNKLLQQLAFDLEHLIDIQGITSNINHAAGNEDFDALELDEYHELHTISRRLIEIAADSMALGNDLNHDLTDLHNLVVSHGVIQKENQELVLRTRMLPVKTIVPRLKRAIRQVCRLTGKDVDLDVADNDVYLDSEVLNELMEPLMHLLRNAVDHGIESAQIRQVAGKADKGRIDIRFVRIGDAVQIEVTDDGQGMDADRIRAKAVQAGLIGADKQLTQDEIYRLVLVHGFSTRDEATQVSGRGVGLDVVSVKMRELKGSIEIESTRGQGCTFRLSLPVSSFSTHSLLVRVQQYVYAISARGIEEILYPGAGKLEQREEGLVFETENQRFDAMYLEQLFNMPRDRRSSERSLRPILLVRDESGGRRAIIVQDVIDSRHVVVKPLGVYVPRLQGIVGSTILGDGSIAPVIDLPELLQQSTDMATSSQSIAGRSAGQSGIRRYVLVVDDSLSARRSLVQFVRDMGYEVREARDGMEAVSMIEQHIPGLVLVDMEMPRMNGLELTSHIRANPQTSALPVIMITSRSSDKHRRAALEKGVNHFMVKPFAEEELAGHIQVIFSS